MTFQAQMLPSQLLTVVTYHQLARSIVQETVPLEAPQYQRLCTSDKKIAELIASFMKTEEKLTILTVSSSFLRQHLVPSGLSPELWVIRDSIRALPRVAICDIDILS